MFKHVNIPDTHYDWHASLQLIGNNKSAAQELSLMLKELLLEFKEKFQAAFKDNNIAEIHLLAHKLHGGVCYVFAPRVEYLMDQLETACKKNPEDILLIAPYVIPSIEALEQALTTLDS